MNTFTPFTTDLDTFRGDVSLIIQTQINKLANREDDAQSDFVIKYEKQVIGYVKLDVRSRHKKIFEQHIMVSSFGNRTWIDAKTACAASYFFAGIAATL